MLGHTERVAVKEVVGFMDLVALEDGLVCDCLGNVRLASARFADDQPVLACGDELQRVELEAGLTRDFRIERPVELGERELFLKAGLQVAPLDEPRLTPVELVLQNQGEGLKKRLLGALWLQYAGFQRIADT